MQNVVECYIESISVVDESNIDVFNIELHSLEEKDDLYYVDYESKLIHHNCLRKDSLQLAAWHNGATFSLGYDASLVNESLPLWVFRRMRSKFGDLSNKTIGILGMAFKSDCDDIRDSLSYRMKHILENECKSVLCSDPFVESSNIVDTNFLIENSDIVILMTPHTIYKNLEIKKPTVDVWNFFGNGTGL